MRHVPDPILQKINKLDAVSTFILEISVSYNEYCFNLFDLTKEDSDNESDEDGDVNTDQAPLREKFLDRYMPNRA
jgi:hypothetical protein